jgi:hypothetical protein
VWLELAGRHDEIAELLTSKRPSAVWKQLHDEAGLQASLATFRRYVMRTLPEAYARRTSTSTRGDGPQPGEPGASARRWVEALAGKYGGYVGLANIAGFNAGWPTAMRGGAVPRARTIQRLAQALEVAEGDTRAVLDDVMAFWSRVQAPRLRRVRCRVCGREVSLSHAQSTRAFDTASQEWVHAMCAGRVSVECPDCHTHREIIRSRLTQLLTLKVRDGQYFAQCRTCAARANAAEMRDERLRRLIDSRLEWLTSNQAQTAGDRLLDAWHSQNRDQRQPAQFLTRQSQRTTHHELLANLQDEALLRAIGDGDVERGRQLRVSSVPARGRLAARGPSSTKARGHVVLGRLNGIFSLCPLCGLLVYRKNDRFGRGWHPPCFAAWRASPSYGEWSGRRLLAARRGGNRRQSSDFPMPPSLARRGRPVTSVSLADGYRALARQRMGSVPLAVIAADEGVTEPRIVQRITQILKYLPASWELVFGHAGKGNLVRQEMFELPQPIHDGQRAAAKRMAGLGIQSDVIEQVTGVRTS